MLNVNRIFDRAIVEAIFSSSDSFCQAFGFHAHDGELGYLWKCLVIIGGIYSFFFLEYVMRMIVRFKEQSTCDNHDKNEMVSDLMSNLSLAQIC